MNTFVKRNVNAHSLSKISLVYGVGINDADYMVVNKVDGKRVVCPVYTKWANMLKRCYCTQFLQKQPSYIGCEVCTEWLTFSNYAKWHIENYIEGYDLDKDLKVNGNKTYSPETCMFIPSEINQLIITAHKNKCGYPTGVSFIKKERKYKARITIDSKEVYIGSFVNAEDAGMAYTNAKNLEILRKSKQYKDLSNYLLQHIKQNNTGQ